MAEMDFKDLTTELWREYHFPGGEVRRIEAPQKINVSASGGHRVLDAAGLSHYIPPRWIELTWKVKDGHEPFSF